MREQPLFLLLLMKFFQMKAFQINLILLICCLLLSSWVLKPMPQETVEQAFYAAPVKPQSIKKKVKKIKKTPPHDYGHRTQMSAFLLCVLLGFSGAHQFYLKNYGAAITQLSLSLAVLLLFLTGLTLAIALAWLMALALSAWVIADIFLLVFGGLRPKSGKKLIPWD
jgi:TM2 domain-containing membrane protein YozV